MKSIDAKEFAAWVDRLCDVDTRTAQLEYRIAKLESGSKEPTIGMAPATPSLREAVENGIGKTLRYVVDVCERRGCEKETPVIHAADAKAILVALASEPAPKCKTCGGSGVIEPMVNEEEIGQPRGSASYPCPDCNPLFTRLDAAKWAK